MLRTLFFYLTYYPWTLFVLLTALPISLVSEDLVHRWGSLWGRSALLLAGLRVKVQGTQQIQPNRSAVYIVNHQSNFDIPILYAGLPLQFRWLAKQELFDIPLLGLAMRRCGYIPIDRSNSRKSLQSMITAANRINQGTSLIIFPEGTRSPDGQLQPFKRGAFLIALKAQVPIIPVAIRGSAAVMSKGSLRINGAAIDMQIFPAIETAGLTNADCEALMEQVRQPIAKMLQGAHYHDQAAA